MTAYLVATLAVSLYPAYLIGRWVELRRWTTQRDLAYGALATASRRLAEHDRAEAEAVRILGEQRDLLETFAAATETLYQRQDEGAWHRLAWATHRARTELL